MASTATISSAAAICEACAERGRPNEPVYKIGLCEFCYHGLPHPRATSQQLARERIGAGGRDPAQRALKRSLLPNGVRRTRSKETIAKAREDIALFRAKLAERELFLANARTELSVLEVQYLRPVGTLYAELDEWSVKFVERLARIEGTEAAESAVAQVRAQAEESSGAVYGRPAAGHDGDCSAELKNLRRKIVGRVPPDLATHYSDRHEQEQRVARADAANQSSDADGIRRISSESAGVSGSMRQTDSMPNSMKIGHIKRRLSEIERETAILNDSNIARLKHKIDATKSEGRDLLAKMAEELVLRIEFIRGVFSLHVGKDKSMTEHNQRPTALMPGESDTSSRNGSAALATRVLMDLEANESAIDLHLKAPFQGEGGHEEAVCCFRLGFETGPSQVASRFSLGCAYLCGFVSLHDYSQAVAWFRKAAEQGHAHAANSLGVLCEHGLGITQDYEQAFRWYFKAAGQGLAIAQFNLDRLYKDGQGENRGYAQAAAYWYRTAAENGAPIDQLSLALMYAQGKGVPRDDSEAAFWFRKVAQQGDPIAQETLGLMYALGKGVPKDRDEALVWCRKAAEQGYEPALQTLRMLSRERSIRDPKTTRPPSRIAPMDLTPGADMQLGISAIVLPRMADLASTKHGNTPPAEKLPTMATATDQNDAFGLGFDSWTNHSRAIASPPQPLGVDARNPG